MTTEVAILNTTAAVLAADSALTVSIGGKQVYYHGINKIFGLSTWHPIAIMIHGNPDFLGVPWEIIIKGFRDHLNGEKCDSLHEYGDKFFEFVRQFLKSHGIRASDEEMYHRFCEDLTRVLVNQIKDSARNSLGPTPGTDQFRDFVKTKLFAIIGQMEKYAASLPNTDASRTRAKKLEKIPDISKNILTSWFRNIDIDPNIVLRMSNIYKILCANLQSFHERSGIVLAGYGEQEYFPATISYDVHGYAFDTIILDAQTTSVSTTAPAAIVPFGDIEIVNSFLHGVTKKFRDDFGRRVRTALRPRPKPGKIDFDAMADEIQAEWQSKIVAALAPLHRSTLAEIAENLIQLSAIRSNVYDGEGGTGGPVSVAVISKGDGLIWIKRQNYFDLSLNQHYVTRYMRPSTGNKGAP